MDFKMRLAQKRIDSLSMVKLLLILSFISSTVAGQKSEDMKIRLGIHADPLISWFSSDIDSVRNDGARSGFNFGLTLHKYFGKNYAFSTGINIISAGGRLIGRDSTVFDLSTGDNTLSTTTVPANSAIVYKIQYLSVPIGLKLQTNQIGYITYFTDLGIDPSVVIGSKVDIPSNDIENRKAPHETKLFNIGYHIMAGIEYGVGGNTAIVIGLGFQNNFADLTDERNKQMKDRISHKLLSIRFGVNF